MRFFYDNDPSPDCERNLTSEMKKSLPEIVFATHNPHKLAEVRELCEGYFEILSLGDIGCHEDIPETADTLEGNALQKACWVKEKYGYDCFADDTGLMVDALGGEPGVWSARYAGPECDAKANMRLLLERMEGEEDRKARFVTVIALLQGDEKHLFRGEVEGRISTEPHGSAGFGYDPVFVSDESGVAFAEMTPEDKNAISHRGRAMRKLIKYLIP